MSDEIAIGTSEESIAWWPFDGVKVNCGRDGATGWYKFIN